MNAKIAIGGVTVAGLLALTYAVASQDPAPVELADALDAGTVIVADCGVPVCHVALVANGRTRNLVTLANGAPVLPAWLTLYDVHVFAPGTPDERTYTLPPMWGDEATP